MRTLSLLLIILLWSTVIHAEVSVLTELEQIQEKVWYLQRDMTAVQTAVEAQQKALAQIVADNQKQQKHLDVQLTGLNKELTLQREKITQVNVVLEQFGEALTALASRSGQSNNALSDQLGKLNQLQSALGSLQAEVAAQQSGRGQDLGALHTQLTTMRSEMVQMQEEMTNQKKQLLYWGGGVVVLCVLVLVVGFAVLKSRETAL